jgi:hypothetical protein
VCLLNAAVFPACAVGPQLEEFGHPLKNKDLKVDWQIRTNCLPSTLNIYNVGTARWTPQFLSNVVALGEFNDPRKIFEQLSPAINGRDVMVTDDAPRHSRKSIVANPSRGRIYFVQEGVKALPRDVVEGVPTEPKVLESALTLLSNLGISKAELRRKPNSNELFVLRDVTTHSRRDKTTGIMVKRDIARGIFLFRQVDRIGIAGRGVCGGLHINYGNHGKIAEMEFVWRNLHSPRNVPAGDTNQVAKWILQGKATIETEENPASIKRLTITNANIFYLGHNGSEHQSRMYPFVNLGAIAEVNSRQVSVSVNCPITSD